MDWNFVAQMRPSGGLLCTGNEPSRFVPDCEFRLQLSDHWLLKKLNSIEFSV